MTTTKKEIKVKSYLRKGKLVRRYQRLDEISLPKSKVNNNNNNKNNSNKLSNTNKAFISLGGLAATGLLLKRTGLLNKVFAKRIKPNNKVSSLVLRKHSVEEIERELLGRSSGSIKFNNVKIKKSPPLFIAQALVGFNASTINAAYVKLSKIYITNKKKVADIDEFISKHTKTPYYRFNLPPNLFGVYNKKDALARQLAQDKSKLAWELKGLKDKKGAYEITPQIREFISNTYNTQINEGNNLVDKELGNIISGYSNTRVSMGSSALYAFRKLSKKERDLVLLNETLITRNPKIEQRNRDFYNQQVDKIFIETKSKVSTTYEENTLLYRLNTGYDLKFGSGALLSSKGIPKKLLSLRNSADNISGPEGENAKRKYREALLEYKKQNPDVKDIKSETANDAQVRKLEYLSNLGYTTYNFN